ncbi:hypothetical protein [Pseudomonas sp. Marseille-QA0892]
MNRETAPDYDEYGDVPDSADTTTTDEREDQDDSPLSEIPPGRERTGHGQPGQGR